MKKAKTFALNKSKTTPIPDVLPLIPPSSTFPIVGIGASAGGLAAFEAFFSGMPADTDPGMAFVLVQHLAPDHKSILTELIRRYTRMQVFEVEDGMVVQPNCAYIIPPGRDMAFLNGALQLLEPISPRGQRLPIDFFFRSLAQDQHERAICVVLSGTGSDGTLGVRAIKGEGGMVMAQNPSSTEYDGMPRSAIGTGLVDYELPPGGNAGADYCLCEPRIWQATTSGRRAGTDTGECAQESVHPAPCADRLRFFPIQTEHHPPARRTAHGGASDCDAGGLCQIFAADAGRGGSVVPRFADWRDEFLPRPGSVQGVG